MTVWIYELRMDLPFTYGFTKERVEGIAQPCRCWQSWKQLLLHCNNCYIARCSCNPRDGITNPPKYYTLEIQGARSPFFLYPFGAKWNKTGFSTLTHKFVQSRAAAGKVGTTLCSTQLLAVTAAILELLQNAMEQ